MVGIFRKAEGRAGILEGGLEGGLAREPVV